MTRRPARGAGEERSSDSVGPWLPTVIARNRQELDEILTAMSVLIWNALDHPLVIAWEKELKQELPDTFPSLNPSELIMRKDQLAPVFRHLFLERAETICSAIGLASPLLAEKLAQTMLVQVLGQLNGRSVGLTWELTSLNLTPLADALSREVAPAARRIVDDVERGERPELLEPGADWQAAIADAYRDMHQLPKPTVPRTRSVPIGLRAQALWFARVGDEDSSGPWGPAKVARWVMDNGLRKYATEESALRNVLRWISELERMLEIAPAPGR